MQGWIFICYRSKMTSTREEIPPVNLPCQLKRFKMIYWRWSFRNLAKM